MDSKDQDNKSSFGFNPAPGGPVMQFNARPWGITDEDKLFTGIGLKMYESKSSTKRGSGSGIYSIIAEDIDNY